MDNIFYKTNNFGELLGLFCRKPYSKWTISSTLDLKTSVLTSSGRKPYSKWTISSTHQKS